MADSWIKSLTVGRIAGALTLITADQAAEAFGKIYAVPAAYGLTMSDAKQAAWIGLIALFLKAYGGTVILLSKARQQKGEE